MEVDPEMQPLFHFRAIGIPEPQGSARAFVRGGRAVVTSDNPDLKSWRAMVRAAAVEAMAARGLAKLAKGQGVTVESVFTLTRPPSVKASKRPRPTVPPDVDKLARALLDSLTGVVYPDDSQVTALWASKVYAMAGHGPGVAVNVWATPS